MKHLALRDEHWELTQEEILLNVLLNVSGRPLILGALHNRSRLPPPPDGPSLAWWKVPCSGSVVSCVVARHNRSEWAYGTYFDNGGIHNSYDANYIKQTKRCQLKTFCG